MQNDPTCTRRESAASGPPDEHRQTTLEQQIASVRADSIAAALAEVRVQRERVRRARVQLEDAARNFERALVTAAAAGASVRELEEPSGLKKSYIDELVKRGRSGR